MSEDDKIEHKQKMEAQWLAIVDRMLDTCDGIFNKIFSGRFLTLLLFALTYCFIAIHVVRAIPVEKISSDFVLGFISGFGGTVMIVLKGSFDTEKKPVVNGKPPEGKL